MAIPKRNEVAEELTWDLSVIFESDDAWQAEFEALQKLESEITAYQGKLGESAERLLGFMKLEDELSIRLEKLHGYASCKADQDLGNNFYQAMRGKASSIAVSLEAALSFARPEIIAIDDEILNGFYAQQPELETYRRRLYKVRRMAAHVLSPKMEELLASAGEMAQSPMDINSILRNAEMTFPTVLDSKGESHELTNGTFVPLMESSDRVLRKNAFEAYYKRFEDFRGTIANTLEGQFKQLRFFAKARKYSSTREAALDATEVPAEVYDNLIEAVHANLDKMYRYVRLRKKALGVDELHMYDVYTPIIDGAAERVSYEAAKSTIEKALAVLGEDYLEILRTGFNERWIDVYENVGKRGGAYSTGNSYPHPFVLMNYKETLDSMFTLAHEMGHALHSYHSCKYQPTSTADYVIFVAEVASTCNEVLLVRYLLANTEDKKQRAYLINHFLESFKSTVYRQTMFAEFEREMGSLSESGVTLTADVLSEKYHELNKLYFGEDMVSDEAIALEWARIPHFFYDYYVFQYATGFSAAVAIANRILTEGESAVSDYKKFLSSGGSADPISLLKIAGIDMGSPEPVNSALSLFGELIEEMEKLLEE